MTLPIRICITLGTRPEAIKLAPVIQQFQQSPDFETQVVLTGQHREMVAQVMDWFGLQADRDLAIMQAQQSLTDITCRSLQGLEALFKDLQPQMVIVQGDTSTAFSAALAAFYQQIPVGHVEAGLRTDNILNPFPEEANRRLISQIAQLHFAPTARSQQNLEKSGLVGDIHLTGNTVIDALLAVAAQSPACPVPASTGTSTASSSPPSTAARTGAPPSKTSSPASNRCWRNFLTRPYSCPSTATPPCANRSSRPWAITPAPS